MSHAQHKDDEFAKFMDLFHAEDVGTINIKNSQCPIYQTFNFHIKNAIEKHMKGHTHHDVDIQLDRTVEDAKLKTKSQHPEAEDGKIEKFGSSMCKAVRSLKKAYTDGVTFLLNESD